MTLHLSNITLYFNDQPAPSEVMAVVDSVQVTQKGCAPAGFQIVFLAERRLQASPDYPLLESGLLDTGTRVQVVVTLGGSAQVLHDGFITHQQLIPGGARPDQIVVTGEDVSIEMDLVEYSLEYPFMPDAAIAAAVLVKWAILGIFPKIVATPSSGLSFQNTPQQASSDRVYLQQLAAQHGYVFYVRPSLSRGTNLAYWGPPPLDASPQPALTANVGPGSNVTEISFGYDPLAARFVWGAVLNSETDLTIPISTITSTRSPQLASRPALNFASTFQRRTLFDHQDLGVIRSLARGQAITNASTDHVATAKGKLDGLRYGHVLQAPGVVGVRGVGHSYDGLYYVEEVTHSLSRGGYDQDFSLSRQGLGTTVNRLSA